MADSNSVSPDLGPRFESVAKYIKICRVNFNECDDDFYEFRRRMRASLNPQSPMEEWGAEQVVARMIEVNSLRQMRSVLIAEAGRRAVIDALDCADNPAEHDALNRKLAYRILYSEKGVGDLREINEALCDYDITIDLLWITALDKIREELGQIDSRLDLLERRISQARNDYFALQDRRAKLQRLREVQDI